MCVLSKGQLRVAELGCHSLRVLFAVHVESGLIVVGLAAIVRRLPLNPHTCFAGGRTVALLSPFELV